MDKQELTEKYKVANDLHVKLDKMIYDELQLMINEKRVDRSQLLIAIIFCLKKEIGCAPGPFLNVFPEFGAIDTLLDVAVESILEMNEVVDAASSNTLRN